jgi:hypothetical protein
MPNESKKKVKSKPSPPKYVSSDDELDSSDEEDEETLLNVMCKNPNERMNGFLMNKRSCFFKRKKAMKRSRSC